MYVSNVTQYEISHFYTLSSMAYQKTPLKLCTKDVVFVKPSKPTPSSVLPLSALDNRPDHNELCQFVYAYRSTNHGSRNSQLDPALVIKKALSKALFYYYPLAGRVVKHDDGKFKIHCHDDYGVPFLEASANCHLSSLHYLDGTDIEVAKHLAFDLPSEDENGLVYPMVFKLTKFLCGGFTIGLGLVHTVCDGTGGSQVFQAIAELARGQSEPSVKPVWERERLMGSTTKQPLQIPIDSASSAVSPFLPSTTLVHECFKVDGESMRRLKLSLMKECESHETMKERFTTFECLAAYVWRARARALKLNHDGKTMLIFLVGVRSHFLDPPLPEGYYGNAVLDAYVVLNVKELSEIPLYEVAKLISESKKLAVTSDFIKNAINSIYPKLEEYGTKDGTVTTLTDLKHLGFLENLDFGGNELVNAIPAPCDMLGVVDLSVFLPPSKLDPLMKGGVRIFASLPRAAMMKFSEEMEALSSLSDP